ncbi:MULTISPECIES: nucleotidyltransferase domain-containing protein [Rhizobium]|jgi:predicted nucleotidyltransferase|uniref:nucleotidyltransferase domain-containing protein n=1 Tax=Rhizobium TaxID=379 RepID=UPI0021B09A80|nr:nucleotidyltransferase domain-containing protein [Rhizobium leguminosarum]
MARPKPESALRFPLSTIFGTEANVRVMRELSLHGGKLSVGNLISRTKISRPPILASLATLTSLRIVTEIGTGYARLFSLNRGSPFSTPVQALFETEERRFADILAAVKECASLFGDKVVAAWVFGSVARGEDNASSDLDVALIADAPDIETIQNGSIDFLAAKGNELSFAPSINTLSVTDLKRLRQSDDPLWKAFLNEGLVVLGPRPETIKM